LKRKKGNMKKWNEKKNAKKNNGKIKWNKRTMGGSNGMKDNGMYNG
jgi:hypothetical protein